MENHKKKFDPRFRLPATIFLAVAVHLQAGTEISLRGAVEDARDGHPLQCATVLLKDSNLRSQCNSSGVFELLNLSPGTYSIEITADGYRSVSKQVDLRRNAQTTVVIPLVPVRFARIDSVSVIASGRLDTDQASYHPFALSAADTENLAGVLADDPMRSVQALPGVASNDDFDARFSLRGEDFSRVGVYLDGVLLHDSLHNLQGTDLSGSASVFNASLVQGLELYEDTRPEELADTSGAALQVHMREADHDQYSFQLNVGLAGADFSAGGPFGRYQKCSWISGFRKTYIQYLLSSLLTDPSMAFGLTDGQGQLNCLVNARNALSLEVVDSYTDLNRTALRTQLGANDVMLVGQHATETNLSWIFAPDDRTMVLTHAAWMTDRFNAQNPATEPLGHGDYGELAWYSNATRTLSASDSLSIGGSFRAIHDGGFEESFNGIRWIEEMDQYHGSDMLAAGYVQNSWTALPNRLLLTVGGRWERGSTDEVSSYSPQAGLNLRLIGSLRMEAGWGQYVQYPDVSISGSNLGSLNLLPMRSTQASAALEGSLFGHMSFRAEFYDRQDRDLLYQPYADPRIVGGLLFIPPINPQYENSLRGYGRGFEATIRRSLSHGISGWLSYAYGHSVMHDGVSGYIFPSDFDQRHTVNAYASYRIRPSVNLSARWTYGSGFPIPGFLTALGPPSLENFYFTEERNTSRIGPYERLDVRMNKRWTHEKHSTALYLEVMNLTDRDNYRFGSLDAYNPATNFAHVTVDQMFPIVPSAGFVFSW
jgi:hypothetical protein